MANQHAHSAVLEKEQAAADHHHDEAAHVAKHVRMYLIIGGSLMLLTLITVGLSYVDFGSHARNVIIALAVASFKAGLVAAIFMHLKGERKTVWQVLVFTTIFVAGLFLLTYLHWWDPITGSHYSTH